MSLKSFLGTIVLVAFVGAAGFASSPAPAEDAATIEKESRAALELLLKEIEEARDLADDATAILVFPEVYKAGLIVGGLYGEGAMFRDDAVDGYYSTGAGSVGAQVGAQTYGYAMFFMNEDAMTYLKDDDGWEIGSSPNIVIFDPELAAAGKFSTASARANTYVFFFNQTGLMAGVEIEGTKISTLEPE